MPHFPHGAILTPLAIAFLTPNPAMAQSAGQDRDACCVRVDCGAFKRTSDRFWIVTRGTIIPAGSTIYGPGQLGLPAGATVEPNLYQIDGFDLADALNQKCAQTEFYSQTLLQRASKTRPR